MFLAHRMLHPAVNVIVSENVMLMVLKTKPFSSYECSVGSCYITWPNYQNQW